EGYEVQEYGEPDAYGHRKKASVAESLADEIKRRTGEETIVSDLTYDLRSGDPDFIDKLVAITFANMAYDAMLEDKSGLVAARVRLGSRAAPRPKPGTAQGRRAAALQHRALSADLSKQARPADLPDPRRVASRRRAGTRRARRCRRRRAHACRRTAGTASG